MQPLRNLAVFQRPVPLLVSGQDRSTENVIASTSGIATPTVTTRVAEQLFEIPIQFQGEWNANLEECGSTRGDSRLWIGADYIEFYESSGPTLEVVVQGEFELRVTTELSGEGDTWLDQRYFQLSEDNQTLEAKFDTTDPGFVRYRCP
jgi:hypothetical protein